MYNVMYLYCKKYYSYYEKSFPKYIYVTSFMEFSFQIFFSLRKLNMKMKM